MARHRSRSRRKLVTIRVSPRLARIVRLIIGLLNSRVRKARKRRRR